MIGQSPKKPIPFYADVAKHVPPPPDLGPCSSCIKWQLAAAFRAVTTPQGLARVSELIKEGHNVPADKIMVLSHCTNPEVWPLVSDDHWCRQFVRAPEIVRSKDNPWDMTGPIDLRDKA